MCSSTGNDLSAHCPRDFSLVQPETLHLAVVFLVQRHTLLSIGFQHLPPKEGCRKPVLEFGNVFPLLADTSRPASRWRHATLSPTAQAQLSIAPLLPLSDRSRAKVSRFYCQSREQGSDVVLSHNESGSGSILARDVPAHSCFRGYRL